MGGTSARQCRDSGWGHVHDFVCHISKLVDVRGGISRGEDDPDVGGEPLEKEFTNEGVGIG